MRKILALLFAITFFCLSIVGQSHAASNKWAIVIGNSAGDNSLGADNDAREMANVLKSKYGFASSNIMLLLNQKATKANVVSAISWLKGNIDASSSVVFFFSGHGSYGGDIAPIDETDNRDEYIWLADQGVRDDELRTLLDIQPAKFLLCFQACYSGGMIPDLSGANRVVITSAKEDTVSVDYGRNSLFGYLFIDRAIKHGYGDANVDGVVSMEEASNCTNLGLMSDNYEGELIP